MEASGKKEKKTINESLGAEKPVQEANVKVQILDGSPDTSKILELKSSDSIKPLSSNNGAVASSTNASTNLCVSYPRKLTFIQVTQNRSTKIKSPQGVITPSSRYSLNNGYGLGKIPQNSSLLSPTSNKSGSVGARKTVGTPYDQQVTLLRGIYD